MTGDELQKEISDAVCSVEGLTDEQYLKLYQNFVDLLEKLIRPTAQIHHQRARGSGKSIMRYQQSMDWTIEVENRRTDWKII